MRLVARDERRRPDRLHGAAYTCAGLVTCKGGRPGSYGSYELDAATLASWGVDFVKMDHCHLPAGNHSDRELYGRMSAALNATGRPITFSLCQWGEDDVWRWGARVAQMYRVSMDHLPFWSWGRGAAGRGVGSGTREIIEWMGALDPSVWTTRAGWMDPDFLMTLYWPTMDFVASRTEYSFWAMWSAPLLVATDVRNLSAAKRSILLNPEVIAIDQDGSDTGARRVRNESSGAQLWARPLADGDRAVLLFNGAAGGANLSVGVGWADVGWDGAEVAVRDVWQRRDLGRFARGFRGSLAPRDVLLLRLRRCK